MGDISASSNDPTQNPTSTAPDQNQIQVCIFEVKGGMYPGRMLRVQGTIPEAAQSFQLHLQNGPDIGSCDIIFNLKFQLYGSLAIFNHYKDRQWGTEETKDGMSFVAGQHFEVLLLCEPEMFKVALNGEHFYEFRHRMPFNIITHGITEDDVVLTSVLIGEVRAVPAGQGSPSDSDSPPPHPASAEPSSPTGPPQINFGPPPLGYGPPPSGYAPPPSGNKPPPPRSKPAQGDT